MPRLCWIASQVRDCAPSSARFTHTGWFVDGRARVPTRVHALSRTQSVDCCGVSNFDVHPPPAEYIAKLQRIKRNMAVADVQMAKNQRQAAALRAKVEEKEAVKAAKRSADAASFSAVSPK